MNDIHRTIESIYAKGETPQLVINGLHPKVIVPDFVREQHGAKLVIYLAAADPLDLVYTDSCLAADLSFGGHVARCTFPWASIYSVMTRGKQGGVVFMENVPDAANFEPPKQGLRVIKGGKDN